VVVEESVKESRTYRGIGVIKDGVECLRIGITDEGCKKIA